MKKVVGGGALLIIFGVALLFFSSCEKDHGPVVYLNPLDSGQASWPPVPHNLLVSVGDRTVHLNWELSDTTVVKRYRIARRDSLDGDFTIIDSTTTRSYVDRGLRNGRTYRYRVCVVVEYGFIGQYSQEIAATPNGFTIAINDGEKYTTSTSVTLKVFAPGGAGFMMLANDSLFAEASWEPFATNKSWHLTSGDGQKRVFLKVRDLDDNETSGFHWDSILLDTRASINALVFSPADTVLSPGDLIHFSVETGEAQGQAEIDIGNVVLGKQLFDDGTHGDQFAEDGTYELSFVVPSGLEVVEASVKARFTDEAGNASEEMTSVKTLTIQKAPEPVTLVLASVQLSPDDSTTAQIELKWTRSQETDFDHYIVYRDLSSPVDASSTPVELFNDIQITTVTDARLDLSTHYFYSIFVYDQGTLCTGSNEVDAITPSGP